MKSRLSPVDPDTAENKEDEARNAERFRDILKAFSILGTVLGFFQEEMSISFFKNSKNVNPLLQIEPDLYSLSIEPELVVPLDLHSLFGCYRWNPRGL